MPSVEHLVSLFLVGGWTCLSITGSNSLTLTKITLNTGTMSCILSLLLSQLWYRLHCYLLRTSELWLVLDYEEQGSDLGFISRVVGTSGSNGQTWFSSLCVYLLPLERIAFARSFPPLQVIIPPVHSFRLTTKEWVAITLWRRCCAARLGSAAAASAWSSGRSRCPCSPCWRSCGSGTAAGCPSRP